MNDHSEQLPHIPGYDINNTYQYLINREETHLEWIAAALAEMEAPLPTPPDGPSLTIERGKESWRPLVQDDVRRGQTFVAKWRPRVEGLSHARNQTMLRLMLGEMLEQTRLLEQALSGEPNLLGRDGEGAGTRGVVAQTRWMGD